jgi:hypothetical protein
MGIYATCGGLETCGYIPDIPSKSSLLCGAATFIAFLPAMHI